MLYATIRATRTTTPPGLLLVVLAHACAGGGGNAADTLDSKGDIESTAITVTIAAPADGEWLNRSPVLVTGTVSPVEAGTVLVNSLEAPVSAGVYGIWLDLPEGDSPVHVEHAASGASADVTVHLDTTPPLLEITQPPRGHVVEAPVAGLPVSAQASDENGLASLLVQEAAQPPVSPLDAEAPISSGTNLVKVEAVDAHGNVSREHRGVLAGPFVPCDALAQMPTIALTMGQEALTTLGVAIAQYVESMDLSATVQEYNPVVDLESLDLSVTEITIQGLVVTPSAGQGTIGLDVSIESVSAQGTILWAGDSQKVWNASITLEGVWLGSTLSVSKSLDGNLLMEAQSANVACDEISLAVTDASGKEVVAPTGVGGQFLESVGIVVSDIVAESLSSVLADAAGFSKGSYELALYDIPITVDVALQQVEVSPSGVRLAMSGRAGLDAPPVYPWPHGCLVGNIQLPAPSDYPGVEIWVAYPLLNQLLLDLWQHGLLAWSVGQAMLDGMKVEVALVCGMLGSLREMVSEKSDPEDPLRIDVSAALPPTLEPAKLPKGAMRLTMADIKFDFNCFGQVPATASAYVSLDLSVALAIRQGELSPTLAVGGFLFDIVGLPDADKRVAERSIETATEGTIAELLPSLAGDMGSMALPTVGGFRLVSGEAGNDPESGWLRIRGVPVHAE